MKKSELPIIGGMFCKKCDAFLSMREIFSAKQIGSMIVSGQYGSTKMQRFEITYRCIKCGYEIKRIAYQ